MSISVGPSRRLDVMDRTCPGSQKPCTSMNSSLMLGAPINTELLAANWPSNRTTP
jgi:hypothetical protein